MRAMARSPTHSGPTSRADRDVGAAVAVYRDGVKVVDLWGGYRNGITKTPWQHDTMVNMFSTTKGIASLAVALAVSRGLFSYDAKVVDYWPEFAQAGKADVTVRQLLSHQAGLSALDAPLLLADLTDPATLSAALAAQAPAWPPGSRHGYHAITLGWYESELIRRHRPGGSDAGSLPRRRDCRAAGAGPPYRTPSIRCRRPGRATCTTGRAPKPSCTSTSCQPHLWPRHSIHVGLLARAAALPRGVDAMGRRLQPRRRARHRDPVGQRDRHSRRRRQLYGAAATGDAALGLTPTVLNALMAEPTAPSRGQRDKVLHVNTVFSLGTVKAGAAILFGSSDKAFGTPGLGGSFGFADPDTGVGFAYVMNRLGFHLCSDPRELALRQALFRDVLGARPQ